MAMPTANARAQDVPGRWCNRCGHRLASSTVENVQTRKRLIVCSRCELRLTNFAGKTWFLVKRASTSW